MVRQLRILVATLAAVLTLSLFGAPSARADVHTTPGVHESGGRLWRTTCQLYSSNVVRCRSEIWATQVARVGGVYQPRTAWYFNNLTYLPSPRDAWRSNPLAAYGVVGGTARWTNADGRDWRTECDTAVTGRGGCRAYIWSTVTSAQPKPGGGYTLVRQSKWVFNNIVQFSSATLPPVVAIPAPAAANALVDPWRGQDVEYFNTGSKVVALTFDAGSDSGGAARILATLAAKRAVATFFVTGSFAREFPATVREIAAAGYPIGNHSDTHPEFPKLTNEQIRAQLAAAEAAVAPLAGSSTMPLFRFPYGETTPLDIRVVNDAGYIPIRWTVDTLSWKGTSGGISVATIRQRVRDRMRPGQIILMHVGAHPDDHSTLDADALGYLIDDLRAAGYSFTTVPELLVANR